jgi:hypothetical protein
MNMKGGQLGWEPAGEGRVKGEGDGRVKMIKVLYINAQK